MILSLQGCYEREERAFIHAPSASTRKVLEDFLPQSVVTAIHNVLPASLQVDKACRECITLLIKTLTLGICLICIAQVEHAVGSANALATGVALAGGLSNSKGNVYFLVPRTGQWGGVCADGFTRLDADTVCRQLGFSRGARELYGVTAGGGVRGDQFGSVPNPFRILSGVTVNGSPPPATLGPNCAAPVAPLVPLQRCPNFAAATNLGANPPPTCPSNRVAGVECAA